MVQFEEACIRRSHFLDALRPSTDFVLNMLISNCKVLYHVQGPSSRFAISSFFFLDYSSCTNSLVDLES